MMKNCGGFIINMSFIVGMMGNVGQANYVVFKVGIIGFMKFVVKEMGLCNICCNVIVFGFIEIDMIESFDDKVKEGYLQNILMNCFGKVEEVVDVCVFLGLDLLIYLFG